MLVLVIFSIKINSPRNKENNSPVHALLLSEAVFEPETTLSGTGTVNHYDKEATKHSEMYLAAIPTSGETCSKSLYFSFHQI